MSDTRKSEVHSWVARQRSKMCTNRRYDGVQPQSPSWNAREHTSRKARRRLCRRRQAVTPLVAKACSPFIMVPTEGANIRATTKRKATPGLILGWWWCVCLSIRASGMQLLKMGQRQCTDPSGWTDQLEPKACFPLKAGSRLPRCKPHPIPRRGKILRGSPTSPPFLRSKWEGRNLFHLLGVGCPGSGSS